MTWDRFVELFYEEYLSEDQMTQKIDEFNKLEQGDMTVRDYGRKFSALARFVPNLVPDEKVKVQWFMRGLKPAIQVAVSSPTVPETFSDALNRAARVDRASREVVAELRKEILGDKVVGEKRKFESGSQNFQSTQQKGQPPKQNSQKLQRRPDQRNNQGNNKRQRTGNEMYDMCNTCKKRHPGQCRLGEEGCYQCGQKEHIRRNCPELINKNGTPDTATFVPTPAVVARVYAIIDGDG